MKATFSKSILAGAVAVASLFAGATAQAATVYPDFTVQKPGPVVNGTFTADRITGDYVEIATFNAANGTFQVSLQWTATGFVANSEGAKLTLQSNTTGLGFDYGLYALYTASGTFAPNADGDFEFFFTPGSGNLQVYKDNGVDTTFGEPSSGATAFTVNQGIADTLLAEGDPLFGYGLLQPNAPNCGNGDGINCGSFGSTTSFQLTAAGSAFFIDPKPFYNLSFQSGNLNNFDPVDTQRITGLLNVSFENQVPEPASLGLLGLGLLGLSAARRRKQAK